MLDAIFGFSQGRERRSTPFCPRRDSGVLLVSVDIPSGWDVEAGPGDADALQPDVLVRSRCRRSARRTFAAPAGTTLAAASVPPALAKKYGFREPPFPGTDQVVKL